MGDRVAHARDALQHPHQVAVLDRLVEILQHEIVRTGVLSRVLPPFGVVDAHLDQHVLHLDPRHVERTAAGGVVVAGGVGKPGTNPQQYLHNLPGPTHLVRKRPPLLDPTHDRPGERAKRVARVRESGRVGAPSSSIPTSPGTGSALRRWRRVRRLRRGSFRFFPCCCYCCRCHYRAAGGT